MACEDDGARLAAGADGAHVSAVVLGAGPVLDEDEVEGVVSEAGILALEGLAGGLLEVGAVPPAMTLNSRYYSCAKVGQAFRPDSPSSSG